MIISYKNLILWGLALLALNIHIPTTQADTAAVQTISYDTTVVDTAWANWKSDMVSSDGAGESPRLRVIGGPGENTTTSEGQSYGVLLSSMMDDQELLDSLWLFAADHLDENGLMHWHVASWGVIVENGYGAATDGDVDFAMGMVTACQKVRSGAWSASSVGIDYCTTATDLITAIYNTEIDHPGVGPHAGLDDNPGYELIPGDFWYLKGNYNDGIVNLSYFSPGYFRVFAEFTGDDRWYDVIDRNYAIANLSQGISGNCSGLVPNWSKYNGEAQYVSWQPSNYDKWSYDAVRFSWRIAVDKYWYDSAESTEILDQIGGFFSSVGIDNVKAEYDLGGKALNVYTNSLFISSASVAIWGADNPTSTYCGDATGSLQSTPQQAYDALAVRSPENYFNDSWRVFSLVLMTDQFVNPLATTTAYNLDMNSDGIISPADAVFIGNRIGDTPSGNDAIADVNDDTVIDAIDMNLVIQAMGQVTD